MILFPEIVLNQKLCFYMIKDLYRFLKNTTLGVYLMTKYAYFPATTSSCQRYNSCTERNGKTEKTLTSAKNIKYYGLLDCHLKNLYLNCFFEFEFFESPQNC